MATSAQRGVVGFARRVACRRDPSPVKERVTQTDIAGVAHQYHPVLAALFGDRRDSCVRAQGVVVSLRKGPRGLSEHRGGYDSSHSWQRPEDLDVAVLALLRALVRGVLELVEQGLQTLAAALPLAVDQTQAWQQQADMFSGSLGHARRDLERGSAQRGNHFLRAHAANAVFAQ